MSASEQAIASAVFSVVAVGSLVLGVRVLIDTFRYLREVMGVSRVGDPWAGYTAEDDARDRAAAGLSPNAAAEIQALDAEFAVDRALERARWSTLTESAKRAELGLGDSWDPDGGGSGLPDVVSFSDQVDSWRMQEGSRFESLVERADRLMDSELALADSLMARGMSAGDALRAVELRAESMNQAEDRRQAAVLASNPHGVM